MARLINARACIPCRARRKKCPEERPVCATCRRLGLRCAYRDTAPNETYSNRSKVLGVYWLASPTYQAQHLPSTNLRNPRDQFILNNLAKLFAPRYLPTYAHGRALNEELIRLSLHVPHVLECLVACFEALTAVPGEASGSSTPQAWNQASRSLRAGLQNINQDETLIFTLPLAVAHMATIEFIGIGVTGNFSVHFEAGVIMVGLFQQNPRCNWSSMPIHASILLLETMLALVSVIMFTAHRERLTAIWKRADIVGTLVQLNPPGEARISRSPGMAGQYDIYEILFDVMMLHRSRTPTDISLAKLDTLEQQIQRIRSTLKLSIPQGQELATAKYIWLAKTYELFCLCLLICTHALKAPSLSRDRHIDRTVRTGLTLFFEAVHISNHALIWPGNILACAVTAPADIARIHHLFRDGSIIFLGAALDRFRKLLHRLGQIYEQPVSSAERQMRLYSDDAGLPRGLLLLRQDGGLLAKEF